MPVFISHSFKDEAVYSAICLAFDGASVPRWDPSTMSVGQSLAEQLRRAINDCQLCIFIATRSSIESPWCLAEVGAFWGSGRTVVIFLADPDLTESVLPPQFKGNLMARNARELITAARSATEAPVPTPVSSLEFFDSAGEFGAESDWRTLLTETNQTFDIMGVTLLAWRQTQGFGDIAVRKAMEGCKVRILMMHMENPMLPLAATDLEMLRVSIPQNYDFFKTLSGKNANIEVRQLRNSPMHFSLTRTDQFAVITHFLFSVTWGRGPTWKCSRTTPLYKLIVQEFDALWRAATPSAV